MLPQFCKALFFGPAAYDPKTGWGPWWAFGTTVVIIIASILVGVLCAEAVASLTGSISYFELEVSDRLSKQEEHYFVIAEAAGQVSTLVLVLLAVAVGSRNGLAPLALRAPAQGWLVLIPAAAIILAIDAVYSLVSYYYWPDAMRADLLPLREVLFSDDWLLFVLIAIVGAPLTEELLFRGFLLSALAQSRLGFWGGALASNLFWASLHAHYSLVGIGSVFLGGLMLSWILWRTGSLWLPIICHGFFNVVALLVLIYVPLFALG